MAGKLAITPRTQRMVGTGIIETRKHGNTETWKHRITEKRNQKRWPGRDGVDEDGGRGGGLPGRGRGGEPGGRKAAGGEGGALGVGQPRGGRLGRAGAGVGRNECPPEKMTKSHRHGSHQGGGSACMKPIKSFYG